MLGARAARISTLATFAGCTLVALVLLHPALAQAARGAAAPHRWVSEVGVDGALATVAAAALWLCAAWLALGLLAGAIAALPGVLGRFGRTTCRALLPRFVRRLVAGTAGIGVLLGPAAAVAAPSTPVPPAPTASGSAPAQLPAPLWPVTATAELPNATWPVSHAPAPSRSRSANTSRPAHARTQRVRVHTGDSLWLIAARRLGPTANDQRIAAHWPRWYAANRTVIGSDPNLIQPGQVLRAPVDPPDPKQGRR